MKRVSKVVLVEKSECVVKIHQQSDVCQTSRVAVEDALASVRLEVSSFSDLSIPQSHVEFGVLFLALQRTSTISSLSKFLSQFFDLGFEFFDLIHRKLVELVLQTLFGRDRGTRGYRGDRGWTALALLGSRIIGSDYRPETNFRILIILVGYLECTNCRISNSDI